MILLQIWSGTRRAISTALTMACAWPCKPGVGSTTALTGANHPAPAQLAGLALLDCGLIYLSEAELIVIVLAT